MALRGPNRATRADMVKLAQSAWRDLKRGRGDQWPYWERICPALKLCRDDAMRDIGLDPRDETPQKNGQYNNRMTRKLQDIGLQDIPRATRKAAIEAAPHL